MHNRNHAMESQKQKNCKFTTLVTAHFSIWNNVSSCSLTRIPWILKTLLNILIVVMSTEVSDHSPVTIQETSCRCARIETHTDNTFCVLPVHVRKLVIYLCCSIAQCTHSNHSQHYAMRTSTYHLLDAAARTVSHCLSGCIMRMYMHVCM